jgi:two-component system chemotaxis response regulator CheY
MGFNLLIVDDSRTVRAVIAKALRIANVPTGEVFEAGNGEEAIAIAREHWIDLILADINMPVMNGLEMIEHMQSDAALATIPVVVVSTEGSATRLERLRELGVRQILRKPFQPEELRDAVQDHLGACEE